MRLTDHYVAGLFDGEGWFNVNRGRRKDVRRTYAFQVHACLVMKEEAVIRALRSRFGGTVQHMRSRSVLHAPYFRWTATGEGAAAFVHIIGRHLLVKRRQAQLLTRFQNTKRRNKNRPLTDAQYARLESMWLEMKRLNKKGPK